MAVTDPPIDLLRAPSLLIGARRVTESSGGEHEHVYAGTGKPTTRVPLGGAREMSEAVDAARQAMPVWRALPVNHRRDLMLRLGQLLIDRADELSALQTLESAVPSQFASTFPGQAADYLAYNAGWADKIGGDVITTWPRPALDYTREEPYGVIGLIIPWNAPLVSLGQLLGPALAVGNTVVLKPSELAPFTSLRVGELALEAGFPPGVVNVVPGGPEGGDVLVRQPGVDKIHFTGSGVTARKVLAAALDNLTPVGLELGGKSALLIFSDTNLMAAAQQVVGGLVALSGQGCTNATRVLVQSSVYDTILRLVKGMIRRIPVGDPFAETTVMGPVVTASACDRILGVIDRARETGAGRLVLGGERLGGELADGYFIAPTVFADVNNDSDLAQQEIFGPVLSFARFDSEEEAIRLANGTRYGLAGYVHTADLRRAHRVSEALAVGNVWVNALDGLPASMPFGGTKQSGYGRLGGREGVREFTRPKNVWLSM